MILHSHLLPKTLIFLFRELGPMFQKHSVQQDGEHELLEDPNLCISAQDATIAYTHDAERVHDWGKPVSRRLLAVTQHCSLSRCVKSS